ncbi:expressed unknown protein [Seminavis robusta]|uniref:Arf-GAP domain-containing protein n=1 Tax=Seminavis robusta TaxID=568900 RepID=A0A9N8H729_9STRA|nr:expressed unknown protein [Seminavis robusta]|eukprot:Sro129_g061590.1 n/a (1020) ;mRNA; f:60254-63466
MTSPEESSAPVAHKKPTPEMNKRMGMVLKTEGNGVCADCPAKRPLWVSFLAGNMDKSRKLAVLCCPKCAQYHHFELGKKRTLIKYLKMAHEFNLADIGILEQSGNTYVNEVFEAKLTKEDFDKLLVLDNDEKEAERRSKFIKDKYKKNKYQDEVVYYQRMLELTKQVEPPKEGEKKEQDEKDDNEGRKEQKDDNKGRKEQKDDNKGRKEQKDDNERKPRDDHHRKSRDDKDQEDRSLRKTTSYNKLDDAARDPVAQGRDPRQSRSRSMDHTAPTLAASPHDTQHVMKPKMQRSRTTDGQEVSWSRSRGSKDPPRNFPVNEARRTMRVNRSLTRSRSPTTSASPHHSRSPHRKRELPPRTGSKDKSLHMSSPSLSFDAEDAARKERRPAMSRQTSLPRENSLQRGDKPFSSRRLVSGSKKLEKLRQHCMGGEDDAPEKTGSVDGVNNGDNNKPQGEKPSEDHKEENVNHGSSRNLRGRRSRQSSPSLSRTGSPRKSVSRESSRRKSMSPEISQSNLRMSRESSRKNLSLSPENSKRHLSRDNSRKNPGLSRENSRKNSGLSRENSRKHLSLSRENSKRVLSGSSHHKKSLSRENSKKNFSYSRENSSKKISPSRQNSLQRENSMRHSAPDRGDKELDDLRAALEDGLQQQAGSQNKSSVPTSAYIDRDSDFRHSAPARSQQEQGIEALRKDFNANISTPADNDHVATHTRTFHNPAALKYQGDDDILMDDSSRGPNDNSRLTQQDTAEALAVSGNKKTSPRSPRRNRPKTSLHDSAPMLALGTVAEDADAKRGEEKDISKNSRRSRKKNFHESAPVLDMSDASTEPSKSLDAWLKPSSETKAPRPRNPSMLPIHATPAGTTQSPRSKKKSAGSLLPSNSPRSKKKSLDFLKSPVPSKGPRPTGSLQRALSQDSLMVDDIVSKDKKKNEGYRCLSSLLNMDSADLTKELATSIPPKGYRPTLRRALSQDSVLLDESVNSGKKMNERTHGLSSLLDVDSADLAKAQTNLTKRESGNLLVSPA